MGTSIISHKRAKCWLLSVDNMTALGKIKLNTDCFYQQCQYDYLLQSAAVKNLLLHHLMAHVELTAVKPN